MNYALAKIKLECQRAANREQKPMAVYNLNSFSPLYVVRDYLGDSPEGCWLPIFVAHPSTIDQGG